MRVQVYWNLHKKCWSVVALEGEQKGRVVSHSDDVCLQDAIFAVQPAGRDRVRKEGRKNVHAFVRGRLTSFGFPSGYIKSVTYNPYKYDTFVFSETKEPVFFAKSVFLGPRGRVSAEV